MIVGFTGTREGWTPQQTKMVNSLIFWLSPDIVWHGDCVGSDEQFDQLAHSFGIRVGIQPPIEKAHRAYCQRAWSVERPLPYLQRNQAIVDNSDMLIATPRGPETKRSGTWATVRYARKTGKLIWILMP